MNKKNFSIFGFYYDNPKNVIDSKKCRCVVGLMLESKSNQRYYNEVNEDLVNKFMEEGLKHKKIKECKCIMAKYPYENFMSIIFAIKKFYSNLEIKLKEKEFIKKYNLNLELKKTSSVEIYKNNCLEFCIPLEKAEQFQLIK